MTTGEEEAESLVNGLFREVDDQFTDLEREYSQARKELAQSSLDRPDTPSNALQASNERFALMSQVATLQAEVSRQSDELDERDRMLNELGDKIAGFETKIAQHNGVSAELHAARQESLDERREQARMSALLDARAAERQELVDVANRLQNDRDHVQE
ncbi:MAG: chromosome segregation ATPase, partial [Candidatus Poriferisodalaceae bacterium]